MDIHPTFDINNREWFLEYEGHEVVAGTLRELQAQLPGVEIVDYYPDGYVATREGFLVSSSRVPFVTTHRMKQRQIDAYRRQIADKDKVHEIKSLERQLVASGVIQPSKILPPPRTKALSHKEQVSVRKRYEDDRQQIKERAKQLGTRVPKPVVDHEMVMQMYATGYNTVEIANTMQCTLGCIQLHRIRGVKKGDRRAEVRGIRRIVVRTKGRAWSQDEDNQLRELAAQGLSSSQIGRQMFRTRNAIIGRCHRKDVQLLCPNHRPHSERIRYR